MNSQQCVNSQEQPLLTAIKIHSVEAEKNFMVGHYVGAGRRSFCLALRVPCSDDCIVVLSCISVSAEGQKTQSEYFSLADRNILCHNISDGTGHLAHVLLEFFGFFSFCLELNV